MIDKLNKIKVYFNDDVRWHELGHAFMAFIMGCLGIFSSIVWFILVFILEFIWETQKKWSKDKLFDLQSKLLPIGLGLLWSLYLWQQPLLIKEICSIPTFAIILFLGWKHKYFKNNK